MIAVLIFGLTGCVKQTQYVMLTSVPTNKNNSSSSEVQQNSGSEVQIQQLYNNADPIQQTIGRAYQLSTLFDGFYLPYEYPNDSDGTDNGDIAKVLNVATFQTFDELKNSLSNIFTDQQVNNLIKTNMYVDSNGELYTHAIDGKGNGPAPIKSIAVNLKTKNSDGSSVYTVKIIMTNSILGQNIYVISKQDITLDEINGSYKVATPLVVNYHSLIDKDVLIDTGNIYETDLADYINNNAPLKFDLNLIKNSSDRDEFTSYIIQIQNNKQTYKLMSYKATASDYDEDCIYKVTTDCDIQLTSANGTVTTKNIQKEYSFQSDTNQLNLVDFKIISQ